jgi:hypothetical protein
MRRCEQQQVGQVNLGTNAADVSDNVSNSVMVGNVMVGAMGCSAGHRESPASCLQRLLQRLKNYLGPQDKFADYATPEVLPLEYC